MPEWVVKFVRRLLALQDGYCYQLMIIKDQGNVTWTLVNTSKIERP